MSFCVLFVCKCVLYYCHRVATQLQLINISYLYHIIITYHSPAIDLQSRASLKTHLILSLFHTSLLCAQKCAYVTTSIRSIFFPSQQTFKIQAFLSDSVQHEGAARVLPRTGSSPWIKSNSAVQLSQFTFHTHCLWQIPPPVFRVYIFLVHCWLQSPLYILKFTSNLLPSTSFNYININIKHTFTTCNCYSMVKICFQTRIQK